MKYWFKNVADNIYIYPKSTPRNLILQTRTSDCNSAKTFSLNECDKFVISNKLIFHVPFSVFEHKKTGDKIHKVQ